MMNRIVLLGRLTRDPELRKTQNDMSVCKYTIAVNRKGEGTDFIECTCFNGIADTIFKYLKKGNQICVEGKLRVDTYKKQDGSNGYKTYVLVETFDFVGTQKETQSETQPSGNESILADEIELQEFELPF